MTTATAAPLPKTLPKTLAGRGEVRGAVSPPAYAAAPSPRALDAVEDQTPVVDTPFSGSMVAGNASAMSPTAAARRNILTVNNSGSVHCTFIGGQTAQGEAVGNKVILNDSVVAVLYGAETGYGSLRNNSVEIHGGTVGLPGGTSVYGARGASSLVAEGNTVIVTRGTVQVEIIGARIDFGAGVVRNNRVAISGGNVRTAYGGMTYNGGDAYGNSVSLSGTGNATGITGGETMNLAEGNFVEISGGTAEYAYGGASVNGALAKGNHVTMSEGIVSNYMVGGFGGEATGNWVAISGGKVGTVGGSGNTVDGGLATAKAQGNAVTVSGGEVLIAIQGGYSLGGDALENIVTIDGAATKVEQIVGGQSDVASATDNKVYMKGGEVRGPVIGGNGTIAASGNYVEMTGGTVRDVVVGGMSMGGGDASGNSVLISGGTVAGGYVAGGSVDTGSAINNTVTLSGGGRTRSGNMPDLSGAAIYGGYDIHGTAVDVFTGNTLNVLEFQGKARTVANFAQYNFFLPAHIANGSVVMQLSEATDISAPPGQSIRARITGMVDGGARLHGGDVIHLLKSDVSLVATGMELTGGNFAQGLTRNYDYELRLTADSLDAVILAAEVPPEVEAPTDGPSADGGLINGGGDLIAGQGMDNALAAARIALRPERSLEQANPWGVGVFGVFTGGQTRYNTPSRLSLASTHYAVGLTKLFDLGHSEWLIGAYLDAGLGSYATQREAAGRPAGGDGDSKYYGGGVLSRYALRKGPLAGAYAEASARTGLVESSYRSEDLQASVGREVKYDRRVPYYSAHGGLGYVYPISSQASVDIYGKFFWSRLERSTQRIAGDEFSFLPLDSYRLRGGARVNYALGDNFSLYAGAAYEHEFDGTPRARVDDMEIKGDNMRGGTGIGELGLSFTLGEEGNFSMDIGGQGFIGKREGLMGTVRAQLAF